MSDFEIVDDKYRELPSGRGRDRLPRTLALREGKTVFVALNGIPGRIVQVRLSSAAAASHKRSHTRSTVIDGVAGVVAWWTDKP